MKFLYEYRTKDNVKHDGVVNAANREAAFALLKSQGIRPGFMKEAPGCFNKVFGKGKRWLAIGVLTIAVVAAIFIIRANNRTIRTIEQSSTSPLPRHQIYGDPALMEELVRTDFANVFPGAGERYLARYAQPGLEAVEERVSSDELRATLDRGLDIRPDDLREVRELKRTVLWMKEEFRNYLSDGVGTPEKYMGRLEKRQNRERQIYAMAQHDLSGNRDEAQWERVNNSLRSLGLPTVIRKDDKK